MEKFKEKSGKDELFRKTVLLIDNYDSFTFNLYQYLSLLTPHVRVVRNDCISVDEIAREAPDCIVISPGPKGPPDAGISKEVIRVLGPAIPILGVCLGHQCINEVFGGRTVLAPRIWHGKTSRIRHDGRTIFEGIPQDFEAARYHSLVADRSCIGDALEISAETEDGLVMGLRHRQYLIEGVQFHPESFLTSYGEAMLKNFLQEISRGCRN